MKYTLALLLALAGCAEGGSTSPEACKLDRKATLAVSWRQTLPIVHATINGHPAELMLDTGAALTVMTTDADQRFNLAPGPGSVSLTGIGGASGRRTSLIETLELGEIQQHSVLTVAVSLEIMSRLKVDGILGRDALEEYDVDLNFPRNEITLYAGRNCATAMPDWKEPAELLPPSPLRRALPANVIAARVNDQVENAMLDSGATGIVVDQNRALALGVTEAGLRSDQQGKTLGIGTVAIALHSFRSVQIGTDVAQNAKLYVQPLIDSNLGGPIHMLIGEAYLRRHRLWISFKGHQVFVARPAKP